MNFLGHLGKNWSKLTTKIVVAQWVSIMFEMVKLVFG